MYTRGIVGTVANSFVGNSNRDFSDRRKYIAERVVRDGGTMAGGGVGYSFMFISFTFNCLSFI